MYNNININIFNTFLPLFLYYILCVMRLYSPCSSALLHFVVFYLRAFLVAVLPFCKELQLQIQLVQQM